MSKSIPSNIMPTMTKGLCSYMAIMYITTINIMIGTKMKKTVVDVFTALWGTTVCDCTSTYTINAIRPTNVAKKIKVEMVINNPDMKEYGISIKRLTDRMKM